MSNSQSVFTVFNRFIVLQKKTFSAHRVKIVVSKNQFLVRLGLAILGLFLIANPALAHHPFGGETPDNFLTGFLSGLGHPVIGIDHLVFVIAVGLLASLKKQRGVLLPIAFVVSTLIGTGIHLLSMDLPLPETIISASVLTFGIILAMPQTPQLVWLVSIGALAGIFHGYAYGEAIIGAQMTPLVAYLLGFASIQLIISLAAFKIGKISLARIAEQPSLFLRFAGFTICGLGTAFLSSVILG